MSSTQEQTDVAIAEKEEIREPSLYDVIIHDNDHTSYEEVIFILNKAFEMDHPAATALAAIVDQKGRGICGTYPKEIAELKVETVEMVKHALAIMLPMRTEQIRMLKFTIEKSSK